MVGFARATKKQCCEALIEAKANFGNAPTSGEPVVGNSTTNKKTAKTKKPSKKDVVPKFMGNYFCLINCLFHPALRKQYALFNCQSNKDVMTRKKVANQDLCKKILVMYNDDYAAAESLDDDWDVDRMHHEPAYLCNNQLDNPANHQTIMMDWKSAHLMVKILHSEYAKVQTNWKKAARTKK
jgi:hypothetical protein